MTDLVNVSHDEKLEIVRKSLIHGVCFLRRVVKTTGDGGKALFFDLPRHCERNGAAYLCAQVFSEDCEGIDFVSSDGENWKKGLCFMDPAPTRSQLERIVERLEDLGAWELFVETSVFPSR